MAWENYGYAFVIDERVGVDPAGNIVAWDHEAWSAVKGGRPGANNPGNVITGELAGFEPAAFAPRSPAPDPTNFGNNSNAVPSYVTGCVGERCGGTGTVASQRSDPQYPIALFTSPCVRPSGCRTRLLMNPSWMKSQQASRWILSSIACVISRTVV
jgi:hypothetical protein